jgi:hypothetical protein
MSAIRQNFHAESEAAINKQINMELYASYVYQSMVNFQQCSFILFKYLFLSTFGSIVQMLHYQVLLNFSSIIQTKSVNMLKNS